MTPRLPPGSGGGSTFFQETRDLLNLVLQQQQESLKELQALKIAVAQMPSRQEIQAMLDQRVPQAVYEVEAEAMKEDIKELKARLDAQPGTVWNRASIVITVVLSAGAVIISLITLLR
jgi:hypothetical protein